MRKIGAGILLKPQDVPEDDAAEPTEIQLDTTRHGAGQWFMPAYLFDIPGIDPTPPLPGPRRCGRDRTNRDGKCKAFPGAHAPACPHHIESWELAEVEKLRRGLVAA